MGFNVSSLNCIVAIIVRMSRHYRILVYFQTFLWHYRDNCCCSLPYSPLNYLSRQNLKCCNNHFWSFIALVCLDNCCFVVQLLISS